MSEYVPDQLYKRLFGAHLLLEDKWPLCREDWRRVDYIRWFRPWSGHILDFGSGDGTLGGMVRSANPAVQFIVGVEADAEQRNRAMCSWWSGHGSYGYVDTIHHRLLKDYTFDAALCCEVLEHMHHKDALQTLVDIRAHLKPGAPILVTVPDEKGSRADYPGHIQRFSRLALTRILKDAGFLNVTIGAIQCDGRTIWLAGHGEA